MTKPDYTYLYQAFRCGPGDHSGHNSPEFVQNVMFDKEVLDIYIRTTGQQLYSPITEYVFWLRNRRAAMCPDIEYKHNNRKLPAYLRYLKGRTLYYVKDKVTSYSGYKNLNTSRQKENK